MCSLGIGARLAAPLGAPFLNQKQKKRNKRMGKKMEFWGTALAGFPTDAWQRESEHETVAPRGPQRLRVTPRVAGRTEGHGDSCGRPCVASGSRCECCLFLHVIHALQLGPEGRLARGDGKPSKKNPTEAGRGLGCCGGPDRNGWRRGSGAGRGWGLPGLLSCSVSLGTWSTCSAQCTAGITAP